MNKLDLAVLERIFEHDVAQAIASKGGATMPAQCFRYNNKRVQRLEQRGYVKRVTRQLVGSQPWLTLNVTGWELTALGHMTYCMSCDDEPVVEGEGRVEP